MNKAYIAVMKTEGPIPGAGFHYMLFPQKIQTAQEAAFFGLMGYVVIEVDVEVANQLVIEAQSALAHQLEIAHLTEKELSK